MHTSPTCDYVYLSEWEGRDALLWEAPDRIKRVLSRGAKNWPNYIDIEAGLNQLRTLAEGKAEGLEAVVLNNSHLLIFSVATSWWAPKDRWLVEQFFVRIGQGPEACAFAALEELAEDWLASHIIMATAFARNDAALGKVYQRFGYSQQSTQYVKEAKWLQSQPSLPSLASP